MKMELIKNIGKKFALCGEILSANAFGDGHINDTFLVSVSAPDGEKKYVLQRINTRVFRNPEAVMQNISAVTDYMRAHLKASGRDAEREAVSIVKALDGKSYITDDEGFAWRVLNYVTNSKSYTRPTRLLQIYDAAYAFGKFQSDLSGFAIDSITETIPRFHDTENRLCNLISAGERDEFSRLSEVKGEYEFALARRSACKTLSDMYKEGKIPLRVTHNDTKLNNVLFDKTTDKPICVVDLDTVMPGFSAHDFGDFVRFSATSAEEDEGDLSKVNFDLEKYELCVKGFLDGTGGALTENEVGMLSFGAIIMTLECGIRFLTDYLSGDVYFKTSREKQNLDRAKNQFKLVSDMEDNYAKMCEIVNKYAQKGV